MAVTTEPQAADVAPDSKDALGVEELEGGAALRKQGRPAGW